MLKKTGIEEDSHDVCQPAQHPILPRNEAEKIAATFAALSDPTRLAILNIIAESGTEVCNCDIQSNFTFGQPTISHHLKVLKDAGLVSGVKRGKWVYYHAVYERVEEVSNLLLRVMHITPSKV